MNLQQLRYFIELAKFKNYKKTAENLYISQSALSKAISKLEEELDVPLFNKNGKKNELSKYGIIFYNYINSGLKSIDDGINQLNLLSNKNKNNISIGAVFSCSTQCVPISIYQFQLEFPDVQFDCVEGTSYEISKDLINSKIDIGLVTDLSYLMNHKNIEKIKLLSYQVILAVPKNHPLANLEEVSYMDIINEPFIFYSSDSANGKILRKSLKEYNLPYPKNIRIEYNNESSIISAIRNGIGIGFVSNTKYNRQADLHFLNIDNILLEFPIYMAWKSDVIMSSITNTYKDYVLRAHHLGSFGKKISSDIEA